MKSNKKKKKQKDIGTEVQEKIEKTASSSNVGNGLSQDIFKKLFIVTAGLLLIIMPLLSVNYGAIGDERCQVPYAEMVLDFYLTLGEDRSCIENTFCPTTYLYGGLFEFITAAINRLLGHDNQLHPIYQSTRHVVNSLFGFLAILFTGLLARNIGGWRCGFLALLFITFTPRFWGHAMNNPKDIPFAAATIIAIYYILKVVQSLPKPKPKDLALLAGAIAMGINIRIGGFLLIGYLGLYFGYEMLMKFGFKGLVSGDSWSKVIRNFKYIIVVVVAGYFAGLLFWPYGLIGPLSNPFSTFEHMSKYPINITILFAGEHMGSKEIPWSYIPHWFAISNPIFILLGFGLSLLLIKPILRRYKLNTIVLVLFTAIFPVAYAIYKSSVLYDGWRHFLFIYPSFVVFSTLSFEYLFSKYSNKIHQIVIGCAIGFLLLLPLKHMIKNHPNDYVYFNEIFGGVDNAFGKYETDYYMNGMKESVEWLIENEKIEEREDTAIIISNCVHPLKVYISEITDHAVHNYTRFYDRNNKDWDYAIYYSRFAYKDQLLNKTWPPKGVIHTVKVDNTPIFVVIKNENNSATTGLRALNSGNYEQAVALLTDAVKYDPNNENAYLNLGLASVYTNNFDDGIKYLKRSLQIYPQNVQAYNILGYANVKKGNYDAAIQYYNIAINSGSRNPEVFNNLGIAYVRKGDSNAAIQCFNYALQLNPNHLGALSQLVNVYQQQGKNKKANQIISKINSLKQGRK